MPTKQVIIENISEISSELWRKRAVIITVLLSAWIFTLAPVRELYFVLIEDWLAGKYASAVFGLSGVLLLCFVTWIIGYSHLAADRAAARATPPWRSRLRTIFLGVMACAPLIGFAYGLQQAKSDVDNIITRDSVTKSEPTTESRSVEREGATPQLPINATRTPFTDEGAKDAFSWITNAQEAAEAKRYLDRLLYIITGVLIIAGAAFIAAGFKFSMRIGDRAAGRLYAAAIGAALLIGVTGIVAGALQHNEGYAAIDVARRLGVIALICLFLICFAVALNELTKAYDRYGIPALTILLALAVAASYFNFNDNHNVTVSPELAAAEDRGGGAPVKRPMANLYGADPSNADTALPLPTNFFDWFDARPQAVKDKFRGRYPVYIVAAEGGGLYASYLTAVALSRLYDRCPALKNHIFAVSGVSGGGVGAGVVAALLNQEKSPAAASAQDCAISLPGGDAAPSAAPDEYRAGAIEAKALAFFEDEFLSPLTASALFPDMMQRFIFWAGYPALDRARAFSASLEATWERVAPGDGAMRDGFRRQWRTSGGAPMLVLNATMVRTGQPVVIAPFRTRPDFLWSLNSDELNSIYPAAVSTVNDIKLSDALGLSARFPLIFPAGGFRGGIYRLVDGGYFENSGVETALRLIHDLGFYKNNPALYNRHSEAPGSVNPYRDVEFRLIVLNEAGGVNWSPAEGLNEGWSPLAALYRTRIERGRMAVDRALASGVRTHMIRLNHDVYPLALSFQLSTRSKKTIAKQIRVPAECIDGKTFAEHAKKAQNSLLRDYNRIAVRRAIKAAYIANQNSCEMKAIIGEIAAPPPFQRQSLAPAR